MTFALLSAASIGPLIILALLINKKGLKQVK